MFLQPLSVSGEVYIPSRGAELEKVSGGGRATLQHLERGIRLLNCRSLDSELASWHLVHDACYSWTFPPLSVLLNCNARAI